MPSVVRISLRVRVGEGKKLQDTGLTLARPEGKLPTLRVGQMEGLHGGSELPTPGGM